MPILNSANNSKFDNREFWNNRYQSNPDLGSGIGSRGQNGAHKRRLLRLFLNKTTCESLLDVGCGDCETVSEIELSHIRYTGLDISDAVIINNRKKFPQRSFIQSDFLKFEKIHHLESDVTLCFEVLIHQHNFHDYLTFVGNLVRLTAKSGMLSGYVTDPRRVTSSQIIAWHEPITDTLSRIGARDIVIEGFSLETDALAFVSFRA